jgi:hypothetical protein
MLKKVDVFFLYFSFACSKRKVPKPACRQAGKKTASGFQRPTNGSIPKPDKPFAPAFYCLIVFHFFNPGLTSPSGF